jgi:dTDP-4-amino-4,6-dideoxygalactose transaminase
MSKKIEFFRHNVGSEEVELFKKASSSLFLTTGEYVDTFEENLAQYLGVKNAVGLTSCTGGLHLALLAANIGPGDEVITTPLSFVATGHSILMAGARPVFADVDPKSGNIDPAAIEEAITKKTKAIMPVHLFGAMVDMKTILRIAKRHKLAVIEDAAHALESERDGIRPGSHSFGACFSFYATKSITSGEGGAFVTKSAATANIIKQLRSHGINGEVAQRYRVKLKHYDVGILGWKYNMDNLQAALLIPQLKKVEIVWKRRADIAAYYRKQFSGLGIEMPEVLAGTKHAHHLFTVWLPHRRRERILDHLNSNGVGATITNYPPMHLFSFYRNKFGFKRGMFPHAERIGDQTLTLPLYSKLTDSEVEYVVQTFKDAVRAA